MPRGNKKEPKPPPDKKEGALTVSRRQFIQTAGLAAAVASCAPRGKPKTTNGTPPPDAAAPGRDRILGPGKVPVSVTVNGRAVTLKVEPRTTLAQALREELGLTGTKIGCDRGACGACTVLLNGRPAASCMMLAVDAEGRKVETIEGLARDRKLHPLQQAFIEHDAMQCGFCTCGMIMSSKVLYERKGVPKLDDVKAALSGNLCRCGTYPAVFEAVRSACRKRG